MNNIPQIAKVALISFFLIVPYVVLFASIWYVKRRGFLTSKLARNLLQFVLLFAILEILIDITKLGLGGIVFFPDFFIAPLYFIQSTVPAMIAVWLVLRILPSPIEQQTNSDLTGTKTLKQAIESILNAEQFLTALRSTLPKGERDAEQGLDYIPFMLHNINERRRSFERSSYIFLCLTIFVGLIFSTVIVAFGYILINDEAAGTPRTIAQIRGEVSTIRRELNLALPSYFENEAFQKIITSSILPLEKLKADPSIQIQEEKIRYAISEARKTGNIKELTNSLDIDEKEFQVNKDEKNQQYYTALTKAKFDIERFLKSQEAAIPNIGTSLDKLDKLISNVNDSLGKSEVQTSDVIKRLALSLVVSSFFLVILRHVAGIYRNHYQEMLQAHRDDLAVRKFYVSYKGSESDPPTRTKIISEFSATSAPASQQPISESSNNESDLSKEEVSGLLKGLLEALVKKL